MCCCTGLVSCVVVQVLYHVFVVQVWYYVLHKVLCHALYCCTGLESTVAAVHQNQQMMMNRYNYNPRAANPIEYFTRSLPPQPAGEVSVLTLPPIKEQGPKH